MGKHGCTGRLSMRVQGTAGYVWCVGMGVRFVGDCAQPEVRLSAVRAHADALLVVDCLVREQAL